MYKDCGITVDRYIVGNRDLPIIRIILGKINVIILGCFVGCLLGIFELYIDESVYRFSLGLSLDK